MAKIVNVPGIVITQKQENGNEAKLTWAIRNGYPRITVFLGNGNTGIDNMIIVPMTFPGVLTFLNMLRGEVKGEQSFYALNNKFVDHVRTEDKIVTGAIKIYDNDEGEREIEITRQEDDKKAIFTFTIDNEWFLAKGISKQDLSVKFVESYVTAVTNLFSTYIATEMKENEKEIEDKVQKEN